MAAGGMAVAVALIAAHALAIQRPLESMPMSSNSHEFNQGALHALNEVKVMALALATQVGLIGSQEEARALKATFDGLVDPLIAKYRKAGRAP